MDDMKMIQHSPEKQGRRKRRDRPKREHVVTDPVPRWRLAVIITGLALLAVLKVGIPVARIWVRPLPPDPVPVQEITATWGSFDEVCVYQYYSQDEYPENPAYRGLLIDRADGEYICLEANGLCSTNHGDCWEAVYRKHAK